MGKCHSKLPNEANTLPQRTLDYLKLPIDEHMPTAHQIDDLVTGNFYRSGASDFLLQILSFSNRKKHILIVEEEINERGWRIALLESKETGIRCIGRIVRMESPEAAFIMTSVIVDRINDYLAALGVTPHFIRFCVVQNRGPFIEIFHRIPACDSLASLLKSTPRFSEETCRLIIKGILEALQIMHYKGLYHGALHPNNIFIRLDDFMVCLSGYGIGAAGEVEIPVELLSAQKNNYENGNNLNSNSTFHAISSNQQHSNIQNSENLPFLSPVYFKSQDGVSSIKMQDTKNVSQSHQFYQHYHHNIHYHSSNSGVIQTFSIPKDLPLDFTPPEFFAGFSSSPASDVWSLACVLLVLLGERPWSSLGNLNNNELCNTIAMTPQQPPLPQSCVLSKLCMNFLMKCFIRDPLQRPSAKILLSHPWIANLNMIVSPAELMGDIASMNRENENNNHNLENESNDEDKQNHFDPSTSSTGGKINQTLIHPSNSFNNHHFNNANSSSSINNHNSHNLTASKKSATVDPQTTLAGGASSKNFYQQQPHDTLIKHSSINSSHSLNNNQNNSYNNSNQGNPPTTTLPPLETRLDPQIAFPGRNVDSRIVRLIFSSTGGSKNPKYTPTIIQQQQQDYHYVLNGDGNTNDTSHYHRLGLNYNVDNNNINNSINSNFNGVNENGIGLYNS